MVENDGGNTTVRYYYDNKWRTVETRNGSDQTTYQYVWGQKYTDELILIDMNLAGRLARRRHPFPNFHTPEVVDPECVIIDVASGSARSYVLLACAATPGPWSETASPTIGT